MTTTILEISALRKIRDAAERAMSWEFPSLVTGKPGNGKSTALLHLTKEFGGIYVEVDSAAKSTEGMVRMLLRAFNAPWGRSHQEDKDRLADVMYWDKPRLLSIDEQQTFEATALRELLRLCRDHAISLLLSGNQERLAKTRPSDEAAIRQIKTRIGLRVSIGPPNPSDCQAMAVEYNVEGSDAYEALANFGGNTCLRELVMTLEQAKTITGGVGSIKLHHIKDAVLSIYGNKEKLKLLSKLTKPEIIRLNSI